MHEPFEALLNQLIDPSSQVGQEFLAEVLSRVSLRAPVETSRVEIASGLQSEGVGRAAQRKIPQGTVSKAVKVLMKEGLLEDGETVLRNEDGRVLSPLRLGRTFCIAGAKVTMHDGCPDMATTALTGLDGTRVLRSRTTHLTDLGSDPWDAVARVLHDEITELQREHNSVRAEEGLRPLKLFGVGVEVGVYVHRGSVIQPRSGGWYGKAPLAQTLEDLFDHAVPVIVENDINALAVLATHDTHDPESDLVVVGVFDEGMGGGLVMDGRLRRGGKGMAMEIGHLIVGQAAGRRLPAGDGPPNSDVDPSLRDFDARCFCGAVGHLNAVASPKRIRSLLGVATNQEAAEAPARTDSGVPTREYDVFWRAGAALGRALAQVINIVNPNRLILWLPAEWVKPHPAAASAAYLAAAREEMSQAYSTGAEDAKLTPMPLPSSNAPVLGARAAAVCVLDSFIDHAKGLDGCHVPQRRTGRAEPATCRPPATDTGAPPNRPVTALPSAR